MKNLKQESGQALLLVMMVITLMVLMSAAILSQSGEGRKATFEEIKIVQSCYIAESGAEKGLAQIKNNPFWFKALPIDYSAVYVGSPGIPFAGGRITTVTITRTSASSNPTTFFIQSLGEFQGARRTIEVRGEMYDPVDFSAGIFVRAGDFQLEQNNDGDHPFPVLTENWYEKNADRIITGDLSGTFNVERISYCPGDINVSGTYYGAGAIVAGGTVTINADLKQGEPRSSLAILSFGGPVGIETYGGLSVDALLYTANRIELGENLVFRGSVVCDTLQIGEGTALFYDDNLHNQLPQWITTGIRLNSWREKYSVF